MPSAAGVLSLLEKMEGAYLSVKQSRCVLVRNRNAGCMKCASACTTGAISIQDNELTVAPEKCVGCGTCANVCPTGALEMKAPTDVELCNHCRDAAKNAEGEAIVVCKQLLNAANGLYDSEKVVGVACLDHVDESLIVALASTGGVRRVTLVQGKCGECEHTCGSRAAALSCDTANMLLETWKSPVRAFFTDKLPAKTRLAQAASYDPGRREFFADLRDSAREAAVASADCAVKETLGVEEPKTPKYTKVDERGVLPQELSERRRRLLSALDELGEPDEVGLATRLWGSIDINMERCTSCRMCATFCPTGAIFKFSTKKGRIGVKHRARQCVNCGCCESVCRTGALTLSNTVFAPTIVSADVRRFVMTPLDNEPSKPQSILKSIKKIIGCDQVYER